MTTTAVPIEIAPIADRNPRALSLAYDVVTHPVLLAGLVLLLAFIAMAIFAPWLAPHDPYAQDLGHRFAKPIWEAKGTWDHVLGTDNLGRDYLSRLIYGSRISLVIGFSAMLLSGLIGSTLGIIAGYYGGRADLIMTYLVTTRLSMPVVLVALAVVALVGSSLTIIIVVLGLLIWDRFAVVMRSSVRQIVDLDYVVAARAVGCSDLRIIVGEILPNVANNLVVVATLETAHAILLEAALSFLGLGVQPPLPSWGLMISEARGMIMFNPWLIEIPGAALFLMLLAINFIGDGLRDVSSPQMSS
jgi:peptide/nickel transport system permease protein